MGGERVTEGSSLGSLEATASTTRTELTTNWSRYGKEWVILWRFSIDSAVGGLLRDRLRSFGMSTGAAVSPSAQVVGRNESRELAGRYNR